MTSEKTQHPLQAERNFLLDLFQNRNRNHNKELQYETVIHKEVNFCDDQENRQTHEDDDSGSAQVEQVHDEDSKKEENLFGVSEISLAEFKQLVVEIYGDEVFQKMAEKELTELFGNKFKICEKAGESRMMQTGDNKEAAQRRDSLKGMSTGTPMQTKKTVKIFKDVML